MADTPWIGYQAKKLYLQSGQFTSTLKTSRYIGAVDTFPTGISWDGTNTPWVGKIGDELYLQSGQFTSTLKTSEYIGAIDNEPQDICTNAVLDRVGMYASDTVIINDTASFIAVYVLAASDTVIINDTAGFIAVYGVVAADAVVINDTANFIVAYVVAAFDTVAINDVASVIAAYAVAASDTIAINDIADFVIVNAAASDAVAINDVASVIAVYGIVASDAVVINDTADFIRAREAVASDAVVINDVAGIIRVYESVGADVFTLIDEAIGRIALNLTYYGALGRANEYFEKRLHEWAWSAASIRNKERALIEARCLMDGLCYKGYKHTVYEVMEQWGEGTVIDDDKLAEIRTAENAQRNEFPRGVDVEVPEDILIAQYEIAHSLLDNKDPELELEILAITSSTYGGVKTMYQREQLPLEHLINMIPNAVAWRQIRPYLRDGDAIKLSRVS